MAKDVWDPNQYDRFKAERSKPFFDLLSMVRPQADARVIDLGCGTGELTAELHRKLAAATTLGIDSSAAMLEKTAALTTASLRFEKGDIQTWAPEEKYDLVFSNAALQWCGNHRDLFARIRNSLNPHGQIAVQMPMNHDYPTHLLASQMSQEEPWKSFLNESGSQESSNLLTAETYAALLFKLGFKAQDVLVRVYGHELSSRDGVIEWVKGTLLTRFQSRLSAEDYAKFLEAYRARLFAILPDERPFFYPFKRILIWARL